MHPFVHAFNPAIAPPWQTKTDFDIFHAHRRSVLASSRSTHLGVRTRPRRRAAACTTPPTRWPHRTASCVDWRERADSCPGVTMPKLVVVERDYPAVAEKMAALGPLTDEARHDHQGRHASTRRPRSSTSAARNGVVADGPRGGPSAARHRRHSVCEMILALSGTTNGRLAVAGLRAAREAHRAAARATWRGTTRARGSPSRTRRHAPVPVDHLARSGPASSTAGGATAPFTHQRRAAQAVAHPHRAAALLPRPRLDERDRRAAADLPAAAGHAPAVRRLRVGSTAHRGAGLEGKPRWRCAT